MGPVQMKATHQFTWMNRLLFLLTIIANVVYIYWRLAYTIPYGYDWITLGFAVMLFVVEMVGMFEMFVHFWGMSKSAEPQLPVIDKDLYPEVDVFIATCEEPLDILRKTVNGCVRMQYPNKEKVHVYICHDVRVDKNSSQSAQQEERLKKSAPVSALANEMGVGYFTRNTNEGQKAGNLNNAMKQTHAPLIVTFDADMIPMHDFLLRTVPFFLNDVQRGRNGEEISGKKVGFIQTPQCFYNPDLFQYNLFLEKKIPNEQDYFYRDIQVARNATNSVIYGGSNTVISREALDSIGGFFTDSITEDFATGMLIEGQGYQCYAIDDPLAAGLSPTDLKSLVKQRVRWARGCIQTARKVNLLFRSDLTLAQKISYVSSVTYWYASIKRLVYIMAPIMFAVFKRQVIICTLPQVLCFWLPTYLLTAFTLRSFSSEIRTTKWTNIYETIMFPALLIPVIMETIGFTMKKFSITKKGSKESGNTYQLAMSSVFTIGIGLSVIGLWNMLTISYYYQTIGYIVVIFWLVSNLISLFFCLLFLIGRKHEEYINWSEVALPFTINVNGEKIVCTTQRIADDFFEFQANKNIQFRLHKEQICSFNVQIGDDMYETDLTVRLKKENDKVHHGQVSYMARLFDPEASNLDVWYGIVHNRIPDLAEVIDDEFGLWDDIEANITQRVKSLFD